MKKEKIVVKCDYCKSNLVRSPSGIKRTNFCNFKCHGAYDSTHHLGQNNPNYKGGPEIVCIRCGKVVRLAQWQHKRHMERATKRFFCSKVCHLANDKNSISFECDQCGKLSLVKASHFEKTKNHFCSRDCLWKWKKGRKMPNVSETLKRKYALGIIIPQSHGALITPNPKGQPRPEVLGEKNGNWRGGISWAPYTPDFSKRFKTLIRKRDNFCCALCNICENDARLLKKSLSIHHIDYDKLNSFPQNCITLCKSCHGLTNGNRNHWTKFFQSLLKERYGYEYTEDQKIILDFEKVNR